MFYSMDTTRLEMPSHPILLLVFSIYLLDKMLIVSTAHAACLHGNVLVVQQRSSNLTSVHFSCNDWWLRPRIWIKLWNIYSCVFWNEIIFSLLSQLSLRKCLQCALCWAEPSQPRGFSIFWFLISTTTIKWRCNVGMFIIYCCIIWSHLLSLLFV